MAGVISVVPSTVPLSSVPSKRIDLAVIRAIIDQAFHVQMDKQGRVILSRRQIGYELFITRFQPEILVDVFVTVIEHFPVVAAECTKYNSWWTPRCYHLVFLIAQAFMSALVPEYVGKKRKEKDKHLKQDSFPSVQINISDEQRCKIIHAVVSLNFDFDSNFWSLTDYVLNFNQCPRLVLAVILDAAKKGQASFTAVNYCIRNEMLSRYIDDPNILFTAALLGPLRARSVEMFAAKRTSEFRQKCREVLLKVEELAYSQEEWERTVVGYMGSIKQCDVNGKVVPYSYAQFCNSVSDLLRDLKGLPPSDDRIDIGWAHHLVKRCAAKYYHEKTWKIENLHEVIWTILAQRPSMRKFVVQTLSIDFQDPLGAEIWRTCKIPPNSRKHIFRKSKETHLDPRSPNPPFLSIPDSVQSVEFVRHPNHLRRVENILEDYADDSYPPVGVDAEWSPYVSYSKASILQLAIPSHIFILDIDAVKPTVLAIFFEKFFKEWKLLKIGYQFGEDLIHLRSAVPNCSALYYPNNLICIGKLVHTLMKESAHRPEVSLDGVFHPEVEANNGPLQNAESGVFNEVNENIFAVRTNYENEFSRKTNVVSDAKSQALLGFGVAEVLPSSSTSAAVLSEEDEDIAVFEKNQRKEEAQSVGYNPLFREIRGLSALCERVLGKPLDKTEKCSVWDRRPLRDLQLRYAALDAYCLLMLYEKCTDWASRLDLNIREICLKQGPPTESLPLFCEEQFLKN